MLKNETLDIVSDTEYGHEHTRTHVYTYERSKRIYTRQSDGSWVELIFNCVSKPTAEMLDTFINRPLG